MSRQGHLSIERMCDLVQVSRAGFYRSLRAHHPVAEEMAVRSAIQGIAVEHRRRIKVGLLRSSTASYELLNKHGLTSHQSLNLLERLGRIIEMGQRLTKGTTH